MTTDPRVEAEARRRYPYSQRVFVEGATFALTLAAADAVRPDTVTTDAELDALLVTAGEAAVPVVILADQRPYILIEDEHGDWWAWSYLQEGDDWYYRDALVLPLPWTVLYRPAAAATETGDG